MQIPFLSQDAGEGGAQYRISGATITVAIVAIFLIILGASIALPATDVGQARFGQLMATAGVALPVLLSVFRLEQAAHTVAATKADTGELLNGQLSAQINDAIQAALITHDKEVHGHDQSLQAP